MERKPRYTLGKSERLKRRKSIEEIFNSGESFSLYPLRVFFILEKQTNNKDAASNRKNSSLQFGVGVSKKNFKKAVERNRIKRLIRETYRLQKEVLAVALDVKKERCLKLFVLYTGNEVPAHTLINQKVGEALDRLIRKLEL